MRILKVYKNGDRYVTGGIASIEPSQLKPVRQYDLSALKMEEIRRLKKNPKDKKLMRKMRRIK